MENQCARIAEGVAASLLPLWNFGQRMFVTLLDTLNNSYISTSFNFGVGGSRSFARQPLRGFMPAKRFWMIRVLNLVVFDDFQYFNT